jgi:PAS domain S-box-containing protein
MPGSMRSVPAISKRNAIIAMSPISRRAVGRPSKPIGERSMPIPTYRMLYRLTGDRWPALRPLKASQAALAASEARQRAIFDNAADIAMIVTDPAGVITDWNVGAENILGWTAEEIRGQNAERFFTPEDRAIGRVDHEMAGALRDGRASDERWHLRKGGE